MIGVINCFKEEGITSFDVIKKLRWILSEKKLGHSGTLDPIASGVLPVFVGKATKLVEYQHELPKLYRAEMVLGKRTDTQDKTGKITEERDIENINEGIIEKIFREFVGIIEQIPPMYSAVNYKGKKLYKLARKGIEVERKPRKITIYDIKTLGYDDRSITFEVECSSGTYIRTLCDDAGLKLGCGGYLNSLVRLRTGSFSLENSFSLEEIKNIIQEKKELSFLLPPGEGLKHMSSITIMPESENLFLKGSKIKVEQFLNKLDTLLINQKVCVYNSKNFLVAIGEVDRDFYIKPVKVLTE